MTHQLKNINLLSMDNSKINIELTRFKVLKDASIKVDEWMLFLNQNLPAVLETLEGEKMYVESIFRENIDGQEYLYWYSAQGEKGNSIEGSSHWIDKKHLEYWAKCIDESYKPVDLALQVSMIPEKIRQTMIKS